MKEEMTHTMSFQSGLFLSPVKAEEHEGIFDPNAIAGWL